MKEETVEVQALPEEQYESAKNEADMVRVLLGAKDIAETYRAAADKMRAAGEYKDAPAMAEEYEKMAENAELEGKESLYIQSCAHMNAARSTAEFSLTIDMFRRLEGYKDSAKRIQKCEAQIRREEKRRRAFRLTIALAAAVLIALTGRYVLQESRQNAARLAAEESGQTVEDVTE